MYNKVLTPPSAKNTVSLRMCAFVRQCAFPGWLQDVSRGEASSHIRTTLSSTSGVPNSQTCYADGGCSQEGGGSAPTRRSSFR